MASLIDLTLIEAARRLRAREFSVRELVGAYREAIAARDGALHAYLEVFDDAFETADRAQSAIDSGEASLLTGIPLAIKDCILIRGHAATAGSKILAGYVAAYDATVIARLRAAGAVFLGRTNCDEFAMGSSTEHSAWGPTRNPLDPERVPGGSSGGSAAAVAACLAAGALGSDTGGSIRQPAAFCGVVGLKPSYGAVSRSGLIALASSLDQIGPIARTVGDARAIFQVIAGPDPLDATTFPSASPESLRGNIRIGVPKEYFGPGLDPGVAAVVKRAIEKAKDFGAEIREISLPHSRYALAAYYIILPAEASANLARFDGIRYGFRSPEAVALAEVYEQTRGAGFGDEPKRRIMLGTFALSHGYYDAYYKKAQQVRRLIREDFERAFTDVDVIAGPTTPTPAFRIGARSDDPLAMYLEDIYTVAINLAGVAGISIPAGTTEWDQATLPVGLQLIAPSGREDRLFSIAEHFESVLS